MSVASTNTIGNVVYENRPWSFDTLSDRIFARLFRGLVYPQIWEDPVCDMAALQLTESDDIICIASGGCNAMSYLTKSPATLTAVDLSPWHVHLNRLKLAAAAHLPDHAAFYSVFGNASEVGNTALLDDYVLPHMATSEQQFWNGHQGLHRRATLFSRGFYRYGVLGTFIGAVHVIGRLAGVDFRALLEAKTLEEQEVFFDREIAPLFESRLVKFLARRRASLFGLGIPPAQYEKLASNADRDIVPVLKARTHKLFCGFPIQDNYFAWQAANRGYEADGAGPVPPYLVAENFDALRSAEGRATVLNRSITDTLAQCPNGSKSVFILLDAQDWMSDQQLNALWSEITRTARSGARVLFRTGGRDDILPGRVASNILDQWIYDAEASNTALATDRSAIYGGVHVYRKAG
ncbi:DUF3419 family protein [Litoreibacter roseus]|uniref:S-adenosylmethionine--diacylglycerol 3-amino-3-carboxypropyl transferase n=1 Tax=Litoreibacter roseus TaxID=2601869 RepID=A0A6N6JM44_9RHOB|nr:DUF3419 family protein [Litoreibacter roseus]GFE67371.1 S-adenosylmethionine--diacylglycerol 3-amino-3-carboxypropyl transferase [Litoreibacter roseus]